ncbi:MAG: hypothetical protein ACKOE3_01985, partial [Betaproteobacteria bacterium]
GRHAPLRLKRPHRAVFEDQHRGGRDRRGASGRWRGARVGRGGDLGCRARAACAGGPVYAAAAKPPASARDPFAAPWAASGPAPQPDAEPAWLQPHAPHPMEVVGVLAREGHTWALLQVDGRLLPLKETNP